MDAAVMTRREAVQAWWPREGAVSLLLAGVAILATLWAPTASLLEFDRLAIENGEWWRVVTGHLVHWTGDHLLWDVLMFAVLGILCERFGRNRFVTCVVVSSLAISACVWGLMPEMNSYRGLSGVDSALFTLASVLLLAEARGRGDRLLAGIIVAALAGFAGKLGYEIVTGSTLFVDSANAGFVPLPLVHIVGGMVGAVIGLWKHTKKEPSIIP